MQCFDVNHNISLMLTQRDVERSNSVVGKLKKDCPRIRARTIAAYLSNKYFIDTDLISKYSFKYSAKKRVREIVRNHDNSSQVAMKRAFNHSNNVNKKRKTK